MGCKESRFLRLLVVMVAAAMQACATQSKSTMEKHYRWQIKYEFWSPDCVERMVIAINGQFPGPTVRARAGDTIVVEVENLMPTEGVVIHWHGIHQVLFFDLWTNMNSAWTLILIMDCVGYNYIGFGWVLMMADRDSVGRWNCGHYTVCHKPWRDICIQIPCREGAFRDTDSFHCIIVQVWE